LDRIDLLAEWSVYVDQVAFALALVSCHVEPLALGVRWNTPIHDPDRLPSGDEKPALIHYHQELDSLGLLRRTGIAGIDRQIDRVNHAITAEWTRASPTPTYEQWLSSESFGTRYAERQGEALALLVDRLLVRSILEVGLADGPHCGFPVDSYVGLDESEETVRDAARRYPGHRFFPQALSRYEGDADLVLCLGSGLSTDGRESRPLIENLWARTGKALVVSGMRGVVSEDGRRSGSQEESKEDSGESGLLAVLREITGDAEIYPIAELAGRVTYVALAEPQGRHPRDYVPDTLASVIDRHPDPLSLLFLRVDARRTTRFYPDHAPRLWEYPVVADLIESVLPRGDRLLDVGAGVTPLAPFLALRGFVVDTVDPSPIRRQWPPRADWNEWDFLDYGKAGLAHRSWNRPLGRVPKHLRFDGVYSISVIEHLPAAQRRELLSEIAQRVRGGGVVILTIDLMRDRNDLWNRNLGEEVEEPDRHGTLEDVVEEAQERGLVLFRQQIVREWGDSHVDIALLAMRRHWSDGPDLPAGRLARVRRSATRMRRASGGSPGRP
jgi:SAM-dependent methyltransferase